MEHICRNRCRSSELAVQLLDAPWVAAIGIDLAEKGPLKVTSRLRGRELLTVGGDSTSSTLKVSALPSAGEGCAKVRGYEYNSHQPISFRICSASCTAAEGRTAPCSTAQSSRSQECNIWLETLGYPTVSDFLSNPETFFLFLSRLGTCFFSRNASRETKSLVRSSSVPISFTILTRKSTEIKRSSIFISTHSFGPAFHGIRLQSQMIEIDDLSVEAMHHIHFQEKRIIILSLTLSIRLRAQSSAHIAGIRTSS